MKELEAKTIPEMPHRILLPKVESDKAYLKRLLDWLYQNEIDGNKVIIRKGDVVAFADGRVREATDKLKQTYENLKDWFVTYIYETTSSIKSVVFGYGNLVDSDIQIMDCILQLGRLLEEAKLTP